ncbi:hypothetical protein BGZ79_010918 [Entomortierella chlamydospora]|nr:hypothetical protein BGZ79_010918 [Entomortierella chlamydospora]
MVVRALDSSGYGAGYVSDRRKILSAAAIGSERGEYKIEEQLETTTHQSSFVTPCSRYPFCSLHPGYAHPSMKISATIILLLSTALLAHALPLIDSNDANKNSPDGTVGNQMRSLNSDLKSSPDGLVGPQMRRSLNTPDLESSPDGLISPTQ